MSSSSLPLRPVVLCGPSGCGKSTLLTRLMSPDSDIGAKFGFSVSHTTRGPRPGEQDKVHYHFTDKETIEAMISRDEFLEHAHFSGNVYGTSRAAIQSVLDSQRVCLLDIDTQGVKQLRALDAQGKGMNCYYIFIDIPSIEVLEKRLRGRGTETEDKIKLRLSKASEERTYGHSPNTFDKIIVNDDLDRAFTEFKQTMLEVNPHLTQ